MSQEHAPALGIVKPKGVPDVAQDKLLEIAETVEKDYNQQKMSFADAVKEQIEQNAEDYEKQKQIEPEVVKNIKAVMPEDKVVFSSTGLPEARQPIATRSDVSSEISLGAEQLKDKAVEKGQELKEKAAEKGQDLKEGAKQTYDKAVEKGAELKDKAVEKGADLKDKALEKGAELKDKAVEKAVDAKDYAGEKASEAKSFISEKAEGVKEGVVHLKDQVVESVVGAKDYVADKAVDAKDFVGEKLHDAKEGAVHLKDQVAEKLGEWTEGVKEKLGVAAEKTSETAEKAVDTVKSGYETAKDKTVDAYETAKDKTSSAVETTKEESASLLEKAREGLESLKERVGSWLGNTEQKIEETIEGTPAETIQERDVTIENKSDRVDLGRQEIITEESVTERLEGEPHSILDTIKDTVVHTATAVKEKVLGPESTDQKVIAEEEAAGILKQPKMQQPAPKQGEKPKHEVKLPTINEHPTQTKHIVEENGDKPLYYQRAKL